MDDDVSVDVKPEGPAVTIDGDAGPSSLLGCDRSVLKEIVRSPEDMQRQAAGMLIQSVFRGKQERKKPKIGIYQVALAKQKSARLSSNLEVAVQSKTVQSKTSNENIEKMDGLGIPFKYRAQLGLLGVVLPRFVPKVEYHFQIAEMQRLSRYRRYAMCLGSLVIFLTLAGLFMGLSEIKDGIPNWFIYNLVFLGLLLTWLGIFFQVGDKKVGNNRKVILLKNIAAVTVLYAVLWQSFDGQSSTSKTSSTIAMTTLVRITLVLLGWTALPQPKHLPASLVINACAPFTWLVGCALRRDTDLSVMFLIEHACYLVVFGFVLYLAGRYTDLDSRKNYLKSRDAQNTMLMKQQEINMLKKSITSTTAEGFFENMFDEERTKVFTLKDTLDNYQAKHAMQTLHEQLISDYIYLGASNGTGAALTIAGIEERFAKLKNLAMEESDRLGSILQELYLTFQDLPEWEPVLKVPTFSNVQEDSSHPKEKVHQTSYCNWWSKPDLYPQSLSRVGIAKEPLQWFACRAQWAKTPFSDILKKAVSDFNQASSVSDLGLSPGQVMRLWNNLNPDNKMEELPFQEGLSLDSSFTATTNHDYLEGGRHAGVQLGPAKDRLRVIAKVNEYRLEPDTCPATDCAEKYVTDWLRARVVFTNPSALAVFFWYLMFEVPSIKIIRCKNKLIRDPLMKGASPKKKAGIPDLAWCIHLNVGFDVQGEQHLGELQLILESFCIAKDLAHKYYEFARAENLAELLAPVLERVPPSKVRPSKDDSVTSLNKTEAPMQIETFTPQSSPGQQKFKKVKQVHPIDSQQKVLGSCDFAAVLLV